MFDRMLLRLSFVWVLMNVSMEMEAETYSSFSLEVKATIQSGFNSYEGLVDHASFQTTYAGDMTVEVTMRNDGYMDVLLKNITYKNPMFSEQERFFGNILFNDVPISSDGSFSSCDATISISNGSLTGIQSWDASRCYAPYPADISGSLTADHKLTAEIMLWVCDRSYSKGEFWHKISIGEKLKPFEYKRSVSVGQYNTIVLPFKPSETQGFDKIYTIVGKQRDEARKIYSLVLKEVSAIEAGVPYVFVPKAAEIIASAPGDAECVCTPVNMSYYYDYDKGITITYKGYGLQGMFSQIPTGSIGYWEYYMDEWCEDEWFTHYSVSVIDRNRFSYAQSGSTIDAFHAFILLQYIPDFTGTINETNTLLFSSDYNPIATGISTSTTNSHTVKYYNVAGQRMHRIQKGINIINGKKIVQP